MGIGSIFEPIFSLLSMVCMVLIKLFLGTPQVLNPYQIINYVFNLIPNANISTAFKYFETYHVLIRHRKIAIRQTLKPKQVVNHGGPVSRSKENNGRGGRLQ